MEYQAVYTVIRNVLRKKAGDGSYILRELVERAGEAKGYTGCALAHLNLFWS